MTEKKRIILYLVIGSITAFSLFFYIRGGRSKPRMPISWQFQDIWLSSFPKYGEASSFTSGSTWYECSRPVKARLSVVHGQIGWSKIFVPTDKSETDLFCHGAGVIEYKGKLTVLRRPEVLALISKYAYKDIRIKALEFKYIQDKDFVHRLLLQYKDKMIGCIILLETPNERKVYLEDEALETFEELDYKVFEGYLSQVSGSDKQLFLESFR